MTALRSLLVLLAIVIALSGCRSSSEHAPVLISYDEAVRTSREKITANGHDLSRYRLANLSEFASKLSPDGKEWWLLYYCSPGPPPPGCSMWVTVNRETGAAEIITGMVKVSR